MARSGGASSRGTAKRDPPPKREDTDDDVESRWSAKRAALAAERRERRLAALETRLLELSEGAQNADDRAGRRLRALLVDLKLAEVEDGERDVPEDASDAHIRHFILGRRIRLGRRDRIFRPRREEPRECSLAECRARRGRARRARTRAR